MKKFLITLMCALFMQLGVSQMPLPCLHYWEESQIANWNGLMDPECLYIYMEGSSALINDTHTRTYLVREGTIAVEGNNEFAVLPDAGSNATFQILANDREQPLEGAWYYPEGTYDVELYRKTEWGVKLPDEIQTLVDNWISNDENNTTLSPAINPFDPEQINVWAEVWEPNTADFQPVYGFYYRDFERIYAEHNPYNEPNMDDPDNWYWREIANDYDFRFRFAPKKDGQHFVRLHLEVTGMEPYVSDVFSFRTLAGDPARSPLKLSPNKHYYVTEADNKVFFPVGQNINIPFLCKCDNYEGEFVNQELDNLPCETCYLNSTNDPCCGLNRDNRGDHWNGGNNVRERTAPLSYYLKYEEAVRDLHAAGGNTFRTMPYPIGFEIEFEKLNNYNERQFMAWEFDQVLNYTDELGMRIQYNMLNHGALGFGHHDKWDWPDVDYVDVWNTLIDDWGFCYNYAEGVDPSEPTTFLTAEGAKSNYKKKVRYVMARFGYACNFTHMELCSEINNIAMVSGDFPSKPEDFLIDTPDLNYNGTNHETVGPYVDAWHVEMADYIKNELKQKHILIAADYTGLAPVGQSPEFDYEDDLSFKRPIINVIAWSHYVSDPAEAIKKYGEHEAGQCNWSNMFKGSTERSYITKIAVTAETGHNNSYSETDDTFFYKNLWANALGGYGSSGMEWGRNFDQPRWQAFGKVSSFMNQKYFSMEGVLNTEDWQPGYLLSNERDLGLGIFPPVSRIYETIFMRKSVEDHQHIVGAIFNRTWNPYTKWNNVPMYPEVDFNDPDMIALNDPYIANGGINNGLVNYSVYTDVVYDEDDQVKFSNMQFSVPYVIRYYDANTLMLVHTEHRNSNLFGHLKLSNFPTLNLDRPIVVYTIDREDYEGLQYVEPSGTEEQSLFNRDQITEPVLEVVTMNEIVDNISTPTLTSTWRVIKLVSTLGQTMVLGNNSITELNSLQLPSGIYIVVLSNGKELKSQKIYLSNE